MLIQHGKQFWRSLRYTAEVDPPHLVAFLMLTLASAVMLAALVLHLDWQFLILGLSLCIGSASCYLVRESNLVERPDGIIQFLVSLILVFSSYAVWRILQPLL